MAPHYRGFFLYIGVSVLGGTQWANIKTSRRYRTCTFVNNRFCWLLGMVAKVKIGVILLNKYRYIRNR